MSISLWHKRARPLPASTDTVVVGAGIAGISAALALQETGIDTLVLDRHTPGWGASGRNAGYLMRGAADNYTAAIRQLGRHNALTLWKLTEANLCRLRERGVAALPHFRDCPSCLVALKQDEAIELQSSLQLLVEDGFQVRPVSIDERTDPLWRNLNPLGGLLNPNDAVCDPIELLAWLGAMLKSPPVPHTRVLQIEQSPSALTIHTDGGRMMAQRVLLCTNAYTNQILPSLGPCIEPNRGQMLALDSSTLPESDRLRFAYYANHGSEYFRQVDAHTVVVGGWRKHFAASERTNDTGHTHEVQSGLESFARTLFGRSLPVIHRWAGTMGFTPDGLPLAGQVDPDDPRLWICAGFTGHGMSLAHELATRTVDAMLGKQDQLALFNPTRFAPNPA